MVIRISKRLEVLEDSIIIDPDRSGKEIKGTVVERSDSETCYDAAVNIAMQQIADDFERFKQILFSEDTEPEETEEPNDPGDPGFL